MPTSPQDSHPAPVFEKRLSPLHVAIWGNPTADGRTNYNVSLTRTYRLPPEKREEGDNGYRTTSLLRKEDLLPASQLLQGLFWKLVDLETDDSRPQATRESSAQEGGSHGQL